jgi:hypothetical protein
MDEEQDGEIKHSEGLGITAGAATESGQIMTQIGILGFNA